MAQYSRFALPGYASANFKMIQNLPAVAVLSVLLTACATPPPEISKPEPEETVKYDHDQAQSSDVVPEEHSAHNAGQDRTSAETADTPDKAQLPQTQGVPPPAAGNAEPDTAWSDNIETPKTNATRDTKTPAEVRGDSAIAAEQVDPTASGQAPPGGALTDQEKIGRLDESLERKLGNFDELILQERLKTQNNKREGTAGDYQGEVAIEEEGRFDGVEVAGQPASGETDEIKAPIPGRLPANAEKAGRDEYEQKPSDADVPEDIPDGRDDDIVARQLREAAMREKDPALRERLWNEYRKYKQGIEKN